MGDNLKVQLLENQLVEVFNQSSLPITVKCLVCERVMNALSKKANEMVNQEAREMKEKGEENECVQ